MKIDYVRLNPSVIGQPTLRELLQEEKTIIVNTINTKKTTNFFML